MPYGKKPYRPVLGGTFTGRRRGRNVRLTLLHQRLVTIHEPMPEPVVYEPQQSDQSIGTDSFVLSGKYAVNLHQRVFLEKPWGHKKNRSVSFRGAIYSTADPDAVPTVWVVVPNTQTQDLHGGLIHWEPEDPQDFPDSEEIGLWTYVYQQAHKWSGPFTVVHELWANAHWATRRQESDSLQKVAPPDLYSMKIRRPDLPQRRAGDPLGLD